MSITSIPQFDHDPPHDMAAEQAVLGAMMESEQAIADVLSALSAEQFYRPAHQAVYRCITNLYAQSSPTDPVAVADELDRRGELNRVGGAPYLHTLIATVPVIANVGHYAAIVAEKSVRRRLIEASTRIMQHSYDSTIGDDVGRMLSYAQEQIDTATTATTHRSSIPSTGDLAQEMMDTVEDYQQGAHTRGVRTGIIDLDELTNGLHPGQMVTIAARPGMGKSVLGLNIAAACSIRQGLPSLICSLEMSRTELMIRLSAAQARVSLSALRSEGGLSADDRDRLQQAMPTITEAPLFIDDAPTTTVAEIRARVRDQQRRHGLRLLVVDYLQLLGGSGRPESRQLEVSEFSRQLKLLAKELDIPLVAISQLNRGPEQRTDKRPLLADLRESGSIEQDSDVVLLIHRPDAYETDTDRAGEADFILAKHREGQQKTVTVAHQMHYSRFVNLAH